jgi:hypothetical protein
MGVRAGDAFWFEAWTRLTNIDDDPVSAAIVQLYPLDRSDADPARSRSRCPLTN